MDIIINMDEPCVKCKKKGVTQNGLYLECLSERAIKILKKECKEKKHE